MAEMDVASSILPIHIEETIQSIAGLRRTAAGELEPKIRLAAKRNQVVGIDALRTGDRKRWGQRRASSVIWSTESTMCTRRPLLRSLSRCPRRDEA